MSEISEGAVVETVVEETPQEEPKLLHEQGLAKSEVLNRLMGEGDYEPEVVPEVEVEEVVAAEPESPVEPAKPADNTIPGLEPEKPAEAPPGPKDDVADAASMEDAPGAGKFRVRNADGAFAETPDVKIDFQIGDKVYKGKGIPELVRMAYDGVQGQRSVAELRHLKEVEVPRLQFDTQQEIARLRAEVDAQIELNAAILADASGETWAKNHEKFAQAQSPEAVARRAQEEAQQLRNNLAEQQARNYTTQVYATQIQPAMDFVAKECPDVSDYTRAGIVADLTKDLLVNGRIPPNSFPEVVRRIQGPYAEAVRAEQKRFSEARKAADAAQAEEKAAQAAALRAAQAKQNALVAPLKPVGGVPASQVQKPLPPPRNKAEALQRIIDRPFAG